MSKISLEDLKQILTRNEVETRLVADIIKEAQQKIAADKDTDDEKPKDGKYQYVVLVYDPEGELIDKEFTGTVLKISEESSVYSAPESVIKAGYEWNTTKKGRKNPVKTLGEACANVPARIAKEFQLKILHKEPCFLVRTDGVIPTENTSQRIDKRKKD